MLHLRSYRRLFPNCFTNRDITRIVAGNVGREDVLHFHLCGVCRAAWAAAIEMADTTGRQIEALEIRLAAASIHTWEIQSMQTPDGSLTCDIERRHAFLRLTIVADTALWSDTVVIWPGLSRPLLLTVGAPQVIPAEQCSSLSFWSVSRPELETCLRPTEQKLSIVGATTEFTVSPGAKSARVDWQCPVHSALAIRHEDMWIDAGLPCEIELNRPLTVRLFSAASAIDLRS